MHCCISLRFQYRINKFDGMGQRLLSSLCPRIRCSRVPSDNLNEFFVSPRLPSARPIARCLIARLRSRVNKYKERNERIINPYDTISPRLNGSFLTLPFNKSVFCSLFLARRSSFASPSSSSARRRYLRPNAALALSLY